MSWTRHESNTSRIPNTYEAQIGSYELRVRGREGSKHAWWYVTGPNFIDSGTAESLERAKELAEAAAKEAAEANTEHGTITAEGMTGSGGGCC